MSGDQPTSVLVRSERAELPAYMTGRPFGSDETGRPVGRTKGALIRATVDYMLECVGHRAAEEGFPAADAQAAALAELISRLNAAIPDRNYHVSAEYLRSEGHSYSVEFDTFLSEICRELSGDPRFHFNRGVRGTPASLVLLARPFSLHQVYRLLPRFAAKLADTDLRVVSVGTARAVIRWYGEKDLARLPEPLHPIFVSLACQNSQGILAAIPQVHSGLPLATVRELTCQLHGDVYCEWEFTWVKGKGREAAAKRHTDVYRRNTQKSGPHERLSKAEVEQEDDAARPASASLADKELPPLPAYLEGPPFGAGLDGQPIRQATGGGLLGTLRQMQDTVGRRKSQELAKDLPVEERRARIAEAQDEAWDRLVALLNSVVPEPRYHVTRDYLLDESNYYSHEFNLYVNEFAREICGDPDFHFHRGLKSIPAALVALTRPLSLRQIYGLLPRLTAKVTEADFQVLSASRNAAVIRWLPARQLAQLPPSLHQRYLSMACPAYQGVFAAIPREHSGLPIARIRERSCALRGDEYCEWEFVWDRAESRIGLAIPIGVITSAALLGYILMRLPGWEWLAAVAALLPAAGGWLLWRADKSAKGEEEAQRLLLETRDTAEKQFDDFQQSNADLQLSNIALKQRLSELTALHAIGQTLSVTLDLEELLDRSLRAVTTHLAFDRGLILLLEERDGRSCLCRGRMIGGTPEMAALTAQVDILLEGSQSFLAGVMHSGQPQLVGDASEEIEDPEVRAYLEALGAATFLVVPLITQGKPVGLLAVDNAITGRSLSRTSQELLSTIGTQIASAVDTARLYQTLEQRVAKRTAELARATHQAEEAQRRMADIIDFLPDATLVIDRDGRVIAWNQAMEEMTGVKAGDMLGKGDYEYAVPFYGERRPILIDLVLLPDGGIQAQYSALQRRGGILMAEALVPMVRGAAATLYATASALRDSAGEIVGAIETIRDISERKQAEEELRQAKAAAEAATQAKSAFLATMSHEIRTPMNAVIGMTSLLLDTPLSAEQREFASTIRASGDALLGVINDILDFSKIEAGRIELEHQPFDVRECVESAVGLVAGQAADKGLELSSWIEPHVPPGIAGDETRLRQILLNLLSNAVKFTSEGEVAVTVNCREDAGTWGRGDAESRGHGDAGTRSHGDEQIAASPRLPVSASQTLHFAVRDTGLGIPPDRMDRLFQSFSQVDSSTTRKYGGTGLGLAISQRLAELMGGRMWVESSGIPGQGSTFHFTIKARPASVPARAELGGAVSNLQGRRLLIVDDNATNRRILTLQTAAWGMQPCATGSPEEALNWLRSGEPFDAAVIDRQMPGMDGTVLAAEMRKLRDARALPLIMASSLGPREPGDDPAPDTAGWAAFLVKPIRASQLYDTFANLWTAPSDGAVAKPAGVFDSELGKRLPLRILLAEDNAVNQKLALRLLERLGYRADLAANGVEAVRALERQTYDVVFMDVQMPEMDGLEAARQICARQPENKRPRIIAMTANAMAEDREACLAAGMDDYLAKPIRVDELVAAIGRCQPLTDQA